MTDKGLLMRQIGCWNRSEKEAIIKTLAVLITNQKQYGKEYSLSDTLKFYEMKLAGRYPVNVIIMAIDVYTDRHGDIPQPADLINIIDPEKPKITYAEYKNALECHARDGFPMFGGHRETIREFEKQRTDESGVPTLQSILEKRGLEKSTLIGNSLLKAISDENNSDVD